MNLRDQRWSPHIYQEIAGYAKLEPVAIQQNAKGTQFSNS